MKGRPDIWQGLNLPGEALPQQVIVEIAGRNRLLIEHHRGIREYSPEKIGVRVAYGTVEIRGRELQLQHMTREQLVITGNIGSVALEEGEGL